MIPSIEGATQLVSGGVFASAVVDGQVWFWGGDRQPSRVEGVDDVVELAISRSSGAACARRSSGEVLCWSFNSPRLQPYPVSNLDDARSISVSHELGCAVRASGTLACWLLQLNSPVLPVTAFDWTGFESIDEISAVERHMCVRAGEEIRCFSEDGCEGAEEGAPRIQGPPGLRLTALPIAGVDRARRLAGDDCATLVDGSVLCWRQEGNSRDELTCPFESRPIEHARDALAVINGCALLENETVRCWGSNTYGQLGAPTEQFATSPVQLQLRDVEELDVGSRHACARTKNGGVFCWGDNGHGQLGDGSQNDRLEPTQVTTIDDAQTLETSATRSCVIRGGGGVWCWGARDFNRDDLSPTKTSRSGATDIGLHYSDLCTRNQAGRISCSGERYFSYYRPNKGFSVGENRLCVIEQSGHLKCLYNDSDASRGPERIGDFVNVRQIAMSSYRNSSCVVLEHGEIFCWHWTDELTVESMERVEGISDAVSVEMGDRHSCALINDGTIRCWGENVRGNLGDGTTEQREGVVQVLGINDAVELGTGDSYSCARNSEGRVLCWGHRSSGRIGDGRDPSEGVVTVQYRPLEQSGVATEN